MTTSFPPALGTKRLDADVLALDLPRHGPDLDRLPHSLRCERRVLGLAQAAQGANRRVEAKAAVSAGAQARRLRGPGVAAKGVPWGNVVEVGERIVVRA